MAKKTVQARTRRPTRPAVKSSRKSSADQAAEKARHFALEAARLLSDSKCEDVVVLDVRGMSQVTNFVVLATGTSERQMRSVSDEVEELGSSLSYSAFRSRGERSPNWSIVDFTDVTVHVFEPNARAFYDLENLWPDAARVVWRRKAGAVGAKTRRAGSARTTDGAATPTAMPEESAGQSDASAR